MIESRLKYFFLNSIRVATYILTLISIWYVCIFILSALLRINYPYELGWYEDEHLYQVNRILTGKPLYTQPSLEYVPFLYGPVFFYLSAFFSLFFGPSLSILRSVSIVATLGTFALIYLFIYRETKSKVGGILGVGLYAATYQHSKFTFDIGRVDACLLFLLLLSLYFTRFGTKKRDHIIAGLFIVCAIFTKQTAIILTFGTIVYYFYSNNRFKKIYLFSVLVFCILFLLLMFFQYGKWYVYYAFYITSLHRLHPYYILVFWLYHLVAFVPYSLIGSLLIIYYSLFKKTHKNIFYICSYFSLIGISMMAIASDGGDNNVLLPAYAIISILFGHFFVKITELKRINVTNLFTVFFVLCLFILQMCWLLCIPLSAIPTKQDTSQITKMYTIINKTKGSVFLINRRRLAEQAHKKRFFHFHPMIELLGYFGDYKPTKEGIFYSAKIKSLIKNKKFELIVLDDMSAIRWNRNPFLKEIYNNYSISTQIRIPYDNISYIFFIPKTLRKSTLPNTN